MGESPLFSFDYISCERWSYRKFIRRHRYRIMYGEKYTKSKKTDIEKRLSG